MHDHEGRHPQRNRTDTGCICCESGSCTGCESSKCTSVGCSTGSESRQCCCGSNAICIRTYTCSSSVGLRVVDH